jgi:hypothetical protein
VEEVPMERDIDTQFKKNGEKSIASKSPGDEGKGKDISNG